MGSASRARSQNGESERTGDRELGGMLARFAREGMGIALLPDFLALHPGFGNGLVRVLADWDATPAHLFAVTPSELQPERIRKLVSFMKENFETALRDATVFRK
jgi:DNA-binding transcriptional LysR family regulator